MTLRIGIHGATGRLGRQIRAEVEAAADLSVAWACGRTLPGNLDADVIIDASTPGALIRLLAATDAPVVSGTTGVDLARLAPRGPFLHAANFSLGIAVLADLAHRAHAVLPGWQVEIVEIHHAQKRDAPSGTALRLAEGLGSVVTGHAGVRDPEVVGVHAVRGGDVVGEHTVYLFGEGERIELRHVSQDRRPFAIGAVRCARWLAGRPVGRYRVEDILDAGHE